MIPKRIKVNIEQLVLHGFAPSDRYRIAEAVRSELARLFAEQGVPPALTHGSAIDRLDGGEFNVAASHKAEVIGGQIARTVYGGLKK